MKNDLPKNKLPKNKHQSKAIRKKYKRRRQNNLKFQSRIGLLNRRNALRIYNRYETEEAMHENNEKFDIDIDIDNDNININNEQYIKSTYDYNVANSHVKFTDIDDTYILGDYHIIDETNKQIDDIYVKSLIKQYIIVN